MGAQKCPENANHINKNAVGPNSLTHMKTNHVVKYQSARVGGINVFYREAGDPANPAIVLLHGFLHHPTCSGALSKN
jgi:hypothetical protein